MIFFQQNGDYYLRFEDAKGLPKCEVFEDNPNGMEKLKFFIEKTQKNIEKEKELLNQLTAIKELSDANN